MRRTARMLLALCGCLLSGVLWAQESRASLEGRITDAQGASVPGASVTVISEDTNVRQETTTNEQGTWVVRFLNPGKYTIMISARGFKVAERKSVTLQVADLKQLDFVLEVGAASESITITAEAPLIDTSASSGGTVVGRDALNEIPVMSRIAYQLAALTPGVYVVEQNQNIAMMWSINAASQIRVSGGRGNLSNEFLLDGMPNHRAATVSFIPPADAVAEFRIMSDTYDAQYGRQAGGTVNVSVKSGTNAYHGNVYEFHRNSALNANLFQSNYAGQSKTLSHYNLYGATLGGPVWLPKVYNGKEKTFFFFSWEGVRSTDPYGTPVRSVPTEQERNGDFTGSFTTQLIGGQQQRVPITIFDPLTVDTRRTIAADGKEVTNPTFGYRQPFPGNRIPRDRIDPIALKVLSFVPLPNAPSLPTGNASSNFVGNAPRWVPMATVLSRLDHTWNNSHKSFATFFWSHNLENNTNWFGNASTGSREDDTRRGVNLDHVWTLSPNKILNIRYSVGRPEYWVFQNAAGFNPADLGFSRAFVQKMEALSFPRITGIFGDIGGGMGTPSYYTNHTWKASLTHVHGNMTFAYGYEFRVIQQATTNYGYQSGQFAFASGWTRRRYDASETGYGSTTATFLLGLPSSGAFPRNPRLLDSQRYHALFLQTSWRSTPRLTLNFGMRWDYQRPFIERFNRMTTNFDPTVVNPISDAAQASYAKILDSVLKDPVRYPFGPQLAQLVPVSSFKVYGAQLFNGVGGQQRAATGSDWHEWQPRFGFAYRLTNQTVLRGGFGRFTQSTATLGGTNGFSSSTPFTASRDSGLTPYDTLLNPFRDGILEPTGSSLGPLTNLGQGVSWVNQSGDQTYAWEYSLQLQREYKGWLFEAGYSHNKTSNIFTSLQQNDVGFQNWNMLRLPRFDSAGKPLAKPYLGDEQIPNPFYQLPGVTGSRGSSQLITVYDLMRPLKVLSGQSSSDNPWGKTQYDALEAKVERRFRSGFSLLCAYTFSKLMEDVSFWGPEVSGPIPEHVIGSEDRPHKLSIAPIFQLPVGRNRKLLAHLPKPVDAVLGGWEMTGQYLIQSGGPITFGTDSFFDGQNFGLGRGNRTLARWFDTSHFVKFPNSQDDLSKYPAWTGVQNLPGTSFKPSSASDPKNGVYADFGNFIRRYPTRWTNVRASRVNELNLGLFKNFRFRERLNAQFRGEFYNLFNHPRFPGPDTSPSSADFGRVGAYQNNQGRIVQLALKLSF